jgi:hypothetical protein
LPETNHRDFSLSHPAFGAMKKSGMSFPLTIRNKPFRKKNSPLSMAARKLLLWESSVSIPASAKHLVACH